MMSQATCERNPYVFVVGCPRSGTTLLQRMLDHHPRLAVANDTHFIPRALEEVIPQAVADVAGPVDPPLSPELVEWVLGYHRFARLGLVEAIVRQAAAEAATYRDFVSALYSEFGRLHGKPLAGEKTPDYVRRLPLLHAVFPWVRTVHIIRDGRDVALSTLEWASEDKGPGKLELWQDEPVAVCALWWQWQVRTGMRDGAVLGPSRYHEVKYEELVAARSDAAERCCVPGAALRPGDVALPRRQDRSEARALVQEGLAAADSRAQGLADPDGGTGRGAIRGHRRGLDDRARLRSRNPRYLTRDHPHR